MHRPAQERPVITVDRPGPLTLLQDLGRPGCAHLGVSPSGAADRQALRLANRLLGNDEDAVALETTFGGLTVTAHDLVWVAVTGAPTSVRVNDVSTSSHTTIALRPGDQLAIDVPPVGVRNYLGVRGGLDAARVLGSASRDTLSGLGPDPVRAGQELTVGRPRQPLPGTDAVPLPLTGPTNPYARLAVSPGPRLDWFAADAWQHLLSSPWTASSDCDRVAVRLEGSPLRRVHEAELPSEGLLRGAVQVPSSGQPLIFLSDHPVTGGYPVIAVLTDAACDLAAQLRPGDTVSFADVRHGRSR
jgi:biotin-dependent carboxylase-like uncharacterized protein